MSPGKPEDSTTARVLNAMMQNWETNRWMHIRAELDFHSEVAATRFTSVLTVHLLLDRALTELLARRLLDSGRLQDLEDIEVAVSRVNFDHRIKMAKAARLISDSCAEDMKAVNKVRNKFAHFQHNESEKRAGLLPEISSSEDFEKYMQSGDRALSELNSRMIVPPVTEQ